MTSPRRLGLTSDPRIPTLLFGVLPCTGGSPYVNLNYGLGPETKAKIRRHWATFSKLWIDFVVAAEHCITHGGHVAFEWPRRCAYWRKRSVQAFIRRRNVTLYYSTVVLTVLRVNSAVPPANRLASRG